jgi:hypothetical protein
MENWINFCFKKHLNVFNKIQDNYKKKLLADNWIELIKTRLKKSVYNFIPYILSGWHD